MMEDSAAEKDVILQKKIKTMGNYVHDSVPVSDNEVRFSKAVEMNADLAGIRITMLWYDAGHRRGQNQRSEIAFRTMRY